MAGLEDQAVNVGCVRHSSSDPFSTLKIIWRLVTKLVHYENCMTKDFSMSCRGLASEHRAFFFQKHLKRAGNCTSFDMWLASAYPWRDTRSRIVLRARPDLFNQFYTCCYIEVSCGMGYQDFTDLLIIESAVSVYHQYTQNDTLLQTYNARDQLSFESFICMPSICNMHL